MKRFLLAIALICSPMVMKTHAQDNMKAFPPADPGMVRFVLNLPSQEDEDAFKVELIVGKTVETDKHNRFFFGGSVEAVNIEGWGFTRYVLKDLGPMAGTLMGVDPSEPKVKRFISTGGEPKLLRYNSKLPLVVYVPEGVEVKYRLWKADPTPTAMEKG
jgi:ecotin